MLWLSSAELLASNSTDNQNVEFLSPDIESIERLHSSLLALLSSNTNRAIEKGERALNLSIEIDSQKHIASSLYFLGVANYFRGYHQASNKYYEQALLLYQSIGDQERIEAVYNNLGVNFSILSKYEKSAEYYSESLELAKLRGDDFGVAQTELNMGLLFHSGGYYDRALDFTYRAKDFFVAEDDTAHIALSLLNLGLIYIDVDHTQSLEYYERALQLFTQIDNPYYVIRSRQNIATYEMDYGDKTIALAMFEELLKGDAAVNLSVQDLGALFVNIAGILQETGEHTKALGYLIQADNLHEIYSLPFSFREQILTTYIDIYLDLNRHEIVRRKIEERDLLQKEILEQKSSQALAELEIIYGLSELRANFLVQTEKVAAQRRYLILLSTALLVLGGLLVIILVLRRNVREKSVIIRLRDKIAQQRRIQEKQGSFIDLIKLNGEDPDSAYAREDEEQELKQVQEQEEEVQAKDPDQDQNELSEPISLANGQKAAVNGEDNAQKAINGASETVGNSLEQEQIQNELFEEICEVVQMQKLYLDSDLRVDHLAKVLRTNSKYISNNINQETGLNFNKFINMYRLEEAKHVMDSPNGESYSLADIAFMVGFKNESTFYRNFKELMLTTPNEYRRTGKSVVVPDYINLNHDEVKPSPSKPAKD